MNSFPAARRSTTVSAFAAAAMMTLATLLGVGQLANHSSTEAQMAQAQTSPVQLAQDRTPRSAS